MKATINFDMQLPFDGPAAGVEKQLRDWINAPLCESAWPESPAEIQRQARRIAQARIAELNAMAATQRARMFPGVGHAIFTGVEIE